MIPKKYRLKQERNFELLFEDGDYKEGEYVSIKFVSVKKTERILERFELDDLKIGFIVSTDIDKRAVMRNKKKRQMREVVRNMLKKKEVKTGYLIALIAKENIVQAEFNEIRECIVSLFIKANLI